MALKKYFVFLDRDGVINKKLEDDYVKSINEFEFLPKAKEAIKNLNIVFDKTIIVTNQRGIGRGLMTIDDLNEVHNFMSRELKAAGARIDGIYFCPHDNTIKNCDCRKPNIGMALQAKKDFPEIDFSSSFMVGDSESDMEFGRNAGMKNIFIISNSKIDDIDKKFIYDYKFDSLYDFSLWALENLRFLKN